MSVEKMINKHQWLLELYNQHNSITILNIPKTLCQTFHHEEHILEL